MQNHYLKYRIPYDHLYSKLKEKRFKRINFFIDLLSISRGFFNKNVIQLEIDKYFETKQTPSIYIEEMRNFLNTMYKNFKYYNPKFIIFYDNGKCEQNRSLYKGYKADRGSYLDGFLSDEHLQLFKQIKKYYFDNIHTFLERDNLSCFLNLENYESDLIPHFVISNGYCQSQNEDTLNIILSVDKDLLQTCQFNNTYQAVSIYKRSISSIEMNLYNDDNAISYIHKKFKRGMLTSKYIPLILAIGGDSADNIKNVKSIGSAKAISIIVNSRMSDTINDFTQLPSILQPHKQLILNNFKITSFEKQISRVNHLTIDNINRKLELLN